MIFFKEKNQERVQKETASGVGFSLHAMLGMMTVVVFFGAFHQILLSRAHPNALYMDSLRLLFQLDQWQAGNLSTFDFWGGSSHRGFVNQLFLLANVSFFDLDVFLANRLTGGVIGLVAAVLCTAWMIDFRRQPGPARPFLEITVAVVMTAVCFSWAGYELLTLDLGLPLWTKNLVFLLFYCAYAYLLLAPPPRAALWAGALALSSPAVILIFGMGWNYAFVGAVLITQALSFFRPLQSDGRWVAIVPAMSVALSMLVYLGSGSVTDSSTRDGLNIGPDVPVLFLYSIGSSLGYPKAILMDSLPLQAVAILGGLVTLVGAVSITNWMRRGAPGSRLPLLLVLYGALVALSVTLARGSDGPWAVMASRYYMDLLLGLVGVIWFAARELQAPSRYAIGWNILVIGGLGCLVITQSLTFASEWKTSPYRAAVFESMNQATLALVPDQDAANLLQSPLEYARLGSEVMRARRLGLYAGQETVECSTTGIAYEQGWHAQEGDVRWSSGQATMMLPPCGCSYFGDFYVPAEQPERIVLIDAGAGLQSSVQIPAGHAVRAHLGKGHARLETSPVTVPSKSQPGSMDNRELGVLLVGVLVSCEAP